MSTITIHGNLDVYTHSKLNTNLQKKCLKYNLPKLMNDTPKRVKDKINTHSLQGFINYGKNDMIHKYVMQHAKSRLFEEIEQLDIITYSYRGHP